MARTKWNPSRKRRNTRLTVGDQVRLTSLGRTRYQGKADSEWATYNWVGTITQVLNMDVYKVDLGEGYTRDFGYQASLGLTNLLGEEIERARKNPSREVKEQKRYAARARKSWSAYHAGKQQFGIVDAVDLDLHPQVLAHAWRARGYAKLAKGDADGQRLIDLGNALTQESLG